MKTLTPEEVTQIYDHYEAIVKLATGNDFNTLILDTLQTLDLQEADSKYLLEVLNGTFKTTMANVYAQMSSEMVSVMTDPTRREELRTQIDKLKAGVNDDSVAR